MRHFPFLKATFPFPPFFLPSFPFLCDDYSTLRTKIFAIERNVHNS